LFVCLGFFFLLLLLFLFLFPKYHHSILTFPLYRFPSFSVFSREIYI
jgi:hypothetical protein